MEREPSSETVTSVPREWRAFRADLVPTPPALEEFREILLGSVHGDDETARPLDLEIGCGVGWHPIRYARENPGRTLIAIEKTREKFGKFQKRIQRVSAKSGALPNLVPVHADAISLIAHAIAERSLDRVFILYPNPAAKNPAERWFRMPFFGHLLGKLKSGGTIVLRTNLESYSAEAREHAVRSWGLKLVGERRFTRAEVRLGEEKTHFERKYLDRGEICYELVFTAGDEPGSLRTPPCSSSPE